MDVLSFLFLALFFSYESHFAFCLLLFPPGLRNTWTAMSPKKCFPQRSTRSIGRCAVRVRRQSVLNRPRRRNRRGHQGRKSPPHLRAQTQWVTSNCLTFNPNRISVSWVVFFLMSVLLFLWFLLSAFRRNWCRRSGNKYCFAGTKCTRTMREKSARDGTLKMLWVHFPLSIALLLVYYFSSIFRCFSSPSH